MFFFWFFGFWLYFLTLVFPFLFMPILCFLSITLNSLLLTILYLFVLMVSRKYGHRHEAMVSWTLFPNLLFRLQVLWLEIGEESIVSVIGQKVTELKDKLQCIGLKDLFYSNFWKKTIWDPWRSLDRNYQYMHLKCSVSFKQFTPSFNNW